MSLHRQLTRALAILVGLVVLCGGISVGAVVLGGRPGEELTGRVQPLRLANSQFAGAVSEMSRGMRGFLFTGEPRYLEAYERGRTAYPSALQDMRRLAAPAERALVEEQASAVQRWYALYDDPAELRAGTAMVSQGKEILDRLLRSNAALDGALVERQRGLERKTRWMRALALLSIVGVAAVAGAVALLAALRVRRSLDAPLAALVATLERLRAGDDAARVRLPEGAPSEVRVVSESVNALAEESQRLRAARSERNRLGDLAREIGRRIRADFDAGRMSDETVRAAASAVGAHTVALSLIPDEHGGALPWRPWREWRQGSLLDAPHLAGAGLPRYPDPTDIDSRGDDDEPDGADSPLSVPAWLTDLYDQGRAGTFAALPEDTVGAVVGGLAGVVPMESTRLWAVGSGRAPIGLLLVSLPPGSSWSEALLEFVQSVAADLGRGLQQAGLYEQQGRLIEQLREMDRIKSDFLSTVSHELRTPLTSIAGYTELLVDASELADDQGRMLRIIERNTVRLQSLIEDLLTLSRMEAGAYSVDYAPVPVEKLLAGVATQLPSLQQGRRLAVTIEDPPAGLAVLGDAAALERALVNLLGNAVKFTPDDGTVRLHAGIAAGHLVVWVSDTGIGIPEAEQTRLFSRFFRGSNAATAAIQGTGLGLSIVHTIVEQHGGSVRIRSREGAGTTVEVRLPLLRAGHGGMPPAEDAFTSVVPAAAGLPAPRGQDSPELSGTDRSGTLS